MSKENHSSTFDFRYFDTPFINIPTAVFINSNNINDNFLKMIDKLEPYIIIHEENNEALKLKKEKLSLKYNCLSIV